MSTQLTIVYQRSDASLIEISQTKNKLAWKQFEVRQSVLHEYNKNPSLWHNDIAKTHIFLNQELLRIDYLLRERKGTKTNHVVSIFRKNPNISVRCCQKCKYFLPT